MSNWLKANNPNLSFRKIEITSEKYKYMKSLFILKILNHLGFDFFLLRLTDAH